MKDYANPLLLLIVIGLLSWKITMSIEAPAAVEVWLLTLCVSGCLVNGLLAVARALSRRQALMAVVWSVVYLVLGSGAWVTLRQEQDYNTEIAAYNTLHTHWTSAGGSPFTLCDAEGRTMPELAAILNKKVAMQRFLNLPEAREAVAVIRRAAVHAAENGRYDILRMIARQPGGFDFNQTADGLTPLIAAVLHNRTRTVHVLVELGANPNVSDASGITPIMHAVVDENRPIVRVLMQLGADPSIRDAAGRDAFSCSRTEAMDDILKQPRQ